MGLLEAALWTLLDRALGPLEPERHVTTLELDSVNQDSHTGGMLRLVPDPVSTVVPMPPAYDPSKGPGHWEHRSIDCDRHGPNVAGYRAYKGAGAFQCCACAVGEQDGSLAAAWAETAKQRQKALQALGWRE